MNDLIEKALHAAEQNMTDVVQLWFNNVTSNLTMGEAIRDMKNDGLKLVKAARKAAAAAASPAPAVAGEAGQWVSVKGVELEDDEEYPVLLLWKGEFYKRIFQYCANGPQGAGFYHPGDEEGPSFLVNQASGYGEVLYYLPYPALPAAPTTQQKSQADA